jgi:hypothetical protein
MAWSLPATTTVKILLIPEKLNAGWAMVVPRGVSQEDDHVPVKVL